MNNGDNKKLDWMYKGANSLVDREDYLLGRSVDKTLEQLNAEEKEKKLGLVPPKNHVEHECIPPSIRDFNKIVQAEQVDISAKLQEDPLVAIKKREEEARRQFLQNPVQLKKLQEALKAQQLKKKKKRRKKSKTSDSESDLDDKIAKKLRYLKEDPSSVGVTKKLKKKPKDDTLDTILMHKFNQLKDKLSQDDLNEILEGEISSGSEDKTKKKNRRKGLSSDDSDSDSNEAKIRKHRLKIKERSRKKKRNETESSSDDSSEEDKSRNKYKYKKDVDKRRTDRDREKSDENWKSKKSAKEVNRRSRSMDRDCYKNSSSSCKDKEKLRSKGVGNYRIREENSSDDKKTVAKKEEPKKKADVDFGSDLESTILKKLRMLRDSAKSKPDNSDSENEEKKKDTQKTTHQKKNKDSSSDESSSDDSDKSNVESRKPSRYNDSDSEEAVPKPKAFGLVKSDGTKLSLGKTSYDFKKSNTSVTKQDTNKPIRKTTKKLSEVEKEKLRKEMMNNAEKREKERSDNLRKYREEDKKEARESANYDKDFLRKELLKTTKNATVETRIKSNLNNIQRSSRHMDSHFSRRK